MGILHLAWSVCNIVGICICVIIKYMQNMFDVLVKQTATILRYRTLGPFSLICSLLLKDLSFIFIMFKSVYFLCMCKTVIKRVVCIRSQSTKCFHFTFVKVFVLILSAQSHVGVSRLEPRHEKTGFFAYAKTKAQISFAVTAKLISAFVFATRTVQFLFFLNPKFQASSPLL